MPAFTSCLDVLTTANLLSKSQLFETKTIGVSSLSVLSDIAIEIPTDFNLQTGLGRRFDIIVICGGYRCDLNKNDLISSFLISANKYGSYFIGLWNGTVALANAGLANGLECAVHPNNHAYAKEKFPNAIVSNKTLVFNERFASSSGVNSSQEVMLNLTERVTNSKLVHKIREVLSCDQGPSKGKPTELSLYDPPSLPETLKVVLRLMESNVEEPLEIEELVNISGLSRRKIERLFNRHLDSTPSKFYLEIRLKHAYRLLLQSNDSITDVAISSGFLTSSHFSNSFKRSYGMSPSKMREKECSR